MSWLPEMIAHRCPRRPEVEAVISALSATQLRDVIHYLLTQCHHLTISDVDEAVRVARQCECWRQAQKAWQEYEAAPSVLAGEHAYRQWQHWINEANKLWGFER